MRTILLSWLATNSASLSLTLRQAADGGLDKWTLDNLMRGELLAVTFASVKNRTEALGTMYRL